MNGKVWGSRRFQVGKTIRGRLSHTPLIKPESIRWLEPLTLLLLFGFLLTLVWLVLS